MKAEKRDVLIFAMAATAIAFIYYGRFFNNFFAYDDFKYLGNFTQGLPEVALGYNTLRLVSNLAWWPVYQLSGLDPAGYHLFGLLLYAANGVLLYLFLLALAKDKTFALFGGLFFLLNSVGADAVFWKATNSSLICLCFYLATLIAYLTYRKEGQRKYYLASLILYLLATFSKEEAASLPFVLVMIELIFLDGRGNKKGLVARIAPFAAIIVLYLFCNWVVFNILLHGHAEPEMLFKFRPLHTLFTGWSVFFLAPDGTGVYPSNPAIYATAAAILASFFLVRDRRLLYFGLGWIFLAFLPQSLTLLGQLNPHTMANSISRYLYITSIGSAVVMSALMMGIKERVAGRPFAVSAVIIIVVFGAFHFSRVQHRGYEWQQEWEPMRYFLTTVRKIQGSFPPASHVFVANPPTGRSFVMQGLQAFCYNPDLSWIYRLDYAPQPGESAFLIYRSCVSEGVVAVFPFSGSLGDIMRTGRRQGWLGPVPGVID